MRSLAAPRRDWSLPGEPYLVAAMLFALAIIVALRATKAKWGFSA